MKTRFPFGALHRIVGLACLAAVQFLAGFPLPAAERIPWTTGRVQGSPLPPAPYRVERLFPSAQFEHPVDLSVMPGSDRIFVADQAGKLWSFRPQSARPPELAIDLRQHHRPFDGVLGFAFHPGFATNRFIFINYNEPGGRENGSFVSRFTVTVPPSPDAAPAIDPQTEKVILRWFSGGHNGCTLAFGPDGFLYVSTGDAADPDPPDGKRMTGQDITDLLASILRIDVDHATGTNAYVVPSDNPFVGTSGARPEVWAFGFRNPYRMAFDRVTGDLWVGDVGWEQWEMIHRVERGGNYGWAITEGPNHNVRHDLKPGPGPIRPAVVSLPHSDAASITGGTVYYGNKLPALRSAYIYGDWETGKFWALRHRSGELVSNDELCDTALKPTAFALDAEGELLILDYNGRLYGLAPNEAKGATDTASFPRRLSETGLFASTSRLEPAAGTMPYRIAAPMWNDHATAQWLLAVPGREAIVTSGGVGNIAGGTWAFPSNTVLARTLTLELLVDEPASARPIETQMLHWDGQAWNPYTYRWRSDGNDADLIGPDGTNDWITVSDPQAPGGRRITPWRFMTRAECLRCHNAWAGEALTLNWLQLGSPAADESQLQRLVAAGLLRLRRAPESVQTLAYPHDDSFSLEERARSWLHVNCSACHRHGAGGAVALQLNHEKPPTEWRALDAKPSRGDFGLTHARVIARGDPFRSTLFHRISTENAGHMPQIGSRLADPDGIRLIRDWIQSLDPDTSTGPEAAEVRKLRTTLAQHRAALAGRGRDAAIKALLSSMSGSLALLDAVTEQPELRSAIAPATTQTNLLIRDLFQRLLPPEARRETLGSDPQPESILKLRGDAARGLALFVGTAQCTQCHVHARHGRAFGPALADIGRKYSRAQLLDQILHPSKIVAPEYRLTTVVTRDDRELNGFVVSRAKDRLVLRDQALVEHRLALKDVAEVRESTLSAMAEGLLAPLTAQEAADLLEFLANPPRP